MHGDKIIILLNLEEYSESNAPRAKYVTVKPESNIYTRCFSDGKTRSFVALPKDKKRIRPHQRQVQKTRTIGEKEKKKSQVTSN